MLILWAEEEIVQLHESFTPELRAIAKLCLLSLESSSELNIELQMNGDELGLFEGNCLLDDPSPDGMPRIRLFLDRLWEWVKEDERDFRHEVVTTYLHELGHFLGWDEDDITQRGLD